MTSPETGGQTGPEAAAVPVAPAPGREPVPGRKPARDREPVPHREPAPDREPVRDREPVLPEQSSEDTDAGWGEYPEPADDRLYRDRPPHWDDF